MRSRAHAYITSLFLVALLVTLPVKRVLAQNASDVNAVRAVEDRYASLLFAFPSVIGLGVNTADAATTADRHLVIEVYSRRALTSAEKREFPKSLEGVPIHVLTFETLPAAVAQAKPLPDTVIGPRPDDPSVDAARRVQERWSQKLSLLPKVVGTGIGVSQTGSGRTVIRVYLSEELSPDQAATLPKQLDGIPVETTVTGSFYAL